MGGGALASAMVISKGIEERGRGGRGGREPGDYCTSPFVEGYGGISGGGMS